MWSPRIVLASHRNSHNTSSGITQLTMISAATASTKRPSAFSACSTAPETVPAMASPIWDSQPLSLSSSGSSSMVSAARAASSTVCWTEKVDSTRLLTWRLAGITSQSARPNTASLTAS